MFPFGNSIIPKDFLLEVSKGNIPGHSLVLKFGHNHVTALGVQEDLWSSGGAYTFYPGTPQIMEILSSSGDDAAGAVALIGANRVRVYGMGDKLRLQQEDVIMAGATPVTLANQYRRIYRMEVIDGRSREGANAGTITCRIVTVGTIAAVIDIGAGQTLMAIYTIPRKCTGYLYRFYANIGRGKDMEVTIRSAIYLQGLQAPFIEKEYVQLYENSVQFYKPGALMLPAKTDVKMSVVSTQNNQDITGGFDILLVEDRYRYA